VIDLLTIAVAVADEISRDVGVFASIEIHWISFSGGLYADVYKLLGALYLRL
jgi:hypothetical protein